MFFILFSGSFASYSLLCIHWEGSQAIIFPLAEQESESCISLKPPSLPGCFAAQAGIVLLFLHLPCQLPWQPTGPSVAGAACPQQMPWDTPESTTAPGMVLATHQQRLARSTGLPTGPSGVFRCWLCRPSKSKLLV